MYVRRTKSCFGSESSESNVSTVVNQRMIAFPVVYLLVAYSASLLGCSSFLPWRIAPWDCPWPPQKACPAFLLAYGVSCLLLGMGWQCLMLLLTLLLTPQEYSPIVALVSLPHQSWPCAPRVDSKLRATLAVGTRERRPHLVLQEILRPAWQHRLPAIHPTFFGTQHFPF